MTVTEILSKRRSAIVCVLVICALALRIAFCFGVVGLHSPVRGDEEAYHRHGKNIAAGVGFVSRTGEPTAARPPLYCIALSGAYRIFGAKAEIARIIQIVLGVVLVILTYALASMLFSSGVALIAMALAAFCPSLIFISGYILTENFYAVLILITLVFFTRIFKAGHLSYSEAVFGGFLLGLCSLARPHGFVYAVFVIITALFLVRGRLRDRGAKACVLILAVVLTIFPWSLRNHSRLGAWIMFSTHGGITFYQSNCQLVYDVPCYEGAIAPRCDLPHWEDLRAAGEVESNRMAWKMGMAFLKENPRLVPRLLARKFLRFWRMDSNVTGGWWFDDSTGLGRLSRRVDIGLVFCAVVLPLFVLGLLVTRHRHRDLLLLYGVILVHTLVALVFHGSLRARVPVEPVIEIFAAAGLVAVFAWTRKAGKGGRRHA